MIVTKRSSATESLFTQSVDGVSQQAAQHGHDKSTQIPKTDTIKKTSRHTKRPTATVNPVATTAADKTAWNAALALALATIQQADGPLLDERQALRAAVKLLVFNPTTGTVTVYNTARHASIVRRRLQHMPQLSQ